MNRCRDSATGRKSGPYEHPPQSGAHVPESTLTSLSWPPISTLELISKHLEAELGQDGPGSPSSTPDTTLAPRQRNAVKCRALNSRDDDRRTPAASFCPCKRPSLQATDTPPSNAYLGLKPTTHTTEDIGAVGGKTHGVGSAFECMGKRQARFPRCRAAVPSRRWQIGGKSNTLALSLRSAGTSSCPEQPPRRPL